MAPPLLTLKDISLTFGGTPLLEGAELSVSPGEKICLVGRNGSGKSTFLKIAAELMAPDDGERFLQPGTTVRYLPQEPDLSGFETVGDYVEAGLGPEDPPGAGARLLAALGLAADRGTEALSGGEARRAALARTLAPQPDILLLDEPTNHLDLPAIEWLETHLRNSRSALVLISHDRRFLEALSRATVWIDRGTCRRLDKGFDSFEAWRDKVLEEEETAQHKLDRKIVREQDWLRYGVTARRKRNQRRLAQLHDLRRQRREHVKAVGTVSLEVESAGASGKLVMEAKGLEKSYDDVTLIKDFSLRVLRGDRLALVGANGCGKTTLVKILTGIVDPDSGTVRRSETVRLQTLDQKRDALKPGWSLSEALTDRGGDTVTVGGKTRHVIGYMKDFLFKPEQAETPIQRLSGGERARLMLARALARPSNLLVLDEPTNDLDLETLDLLQEMLADYQGTVILVSHDRDFIDRVATTVLMPEGEGSWMSYAGGYTDMLSQRGRVPDARTGVEKPVSDKSSGQKADRRKEKTTSAAKLSFKDRQLLETLPDRIEALGSTIEKLEVALANPELYRQDPGAAAETAKALETARAAREKAEERWLELEMLREAGEA